jgi:hypothetical protein
MHSLTALTVHLQSANAVVLLRAYACCAADNLDGTQDPATYSLLSVLESAALAGHHGQRAGSPSGAA